MSAFFKSPARRVVLGILLGVGSFVLWPSPIDAAAATFVAPRTMEGELSVNEALTVAEQIVMQHGHGPEAILVEPNGDLMTGTESGDVVRVHKDGSQDVVANTGGRPFGIKRAPDGQLFVADGKRGLLSIGVRGEVEVLSAEADGVPFRFTDDLDVARDGTVYFTDASDTFGPGLFMKDLMEMRPHGRLLAFDPRTRTTRVLAKDLYFANGVALSADESYLVITETWRNRVLRYDLKGPSAGQLRPLLERLPGYPDNVTRSPRGTYWVALYTTRKVGLEKLLWPRPWLRNLLVKLPASLRPGPKRYGFVIEIDARGTVLRSLHDPTGERLWSTSSAVEHEGRLIIGSQSGPHIGRISL